jgi:hypothetical protein
VCRSRAREVDDRDQAGARHVDKQVPPDGRKFYISAAPKQARCRPGGRGPGGPLLTRSGACGAGGRSTRPARCDQAAPQLVRVRRNSLGVAPVQRLKARWKALGSEKPISYAASGAAYVKVTPIGNAPCAKVCTIRKKPTSSGCPSLALPLQLHGDLLLRGLEVLAQARRLAFEGTAAAERARGLLLGGREGQALVERSNAWMETQDIADPEAYQAAGPEVGSLRHTRCGRRRRVQGRPARGPVVGAMEGTDFVEAPRDKWRWRLRIAVPADVTKAEVLATIRAATTRKGGKLENSAEATKVFLERIPAQRAGRALHVGPYAKEGPTLAAIGEALERAGEKPAFSHVEVYFSDPRRTEPARLRTVLLRETR